MDLIADTTYLVGLWRGQSWAKKYAATHPTKSLGISWVVLGEFWHGAMLAKHDAKEVREFLELGMPITEAAPIVATYGKICAQLSHHRSFKSIGQNDLWIAAVALQLEKPLITRNRRHFDLISGISLEVLGG
jgi:predicted nucleic acid-binding protein